MKHFIMTLCFAGAALTLAACETAQPVSDREAPYATERTVGSQPAPVVADEGERVFKSYQSK